MDIFKPIWSVLGLILAIIVFLFILIGIDSYKRSFDTIEVKNSTFDFQKQVRRKGYVSKGLYMNFAKEIGSTGKYKIEMTHIKHKIFPLLSSNKLYTPEQPWIELDEDHYNNEILKSIFSNPTVNYNMKVDDDFKVEVTSTDTTLSEYLSHMLNIKYFGQIDVKYGGKVLNEVH